VSNRFDGQVALVAGGTGALGGAIAQALLAEGAQVTVTYRRAEEFAALQQSVGGARLAGAQIDVTDPAAAEQLIADLVSERGRLDILVNAVGGYVGGASLWQADPSALERMLSLNLRSGHALARAVAPVLLRSGRGAVVNIAARAALEHGAGSAAYNASKAAALALFDSLAADLAGSGVRVNSVLPSIIDTQANRAAMPDADFARWPKADDIARVVLFLCSDDARVIHGAAIPVYGV
jgi:NAD(P)-dependent dehydrogenase (short-subunit alcohol dehydrogenase family)